MNTTLLLFLIVSLIGGTIHGIYKTVEVKYNPNLGVKPSKNLFDFIFANTNN